LAASAGIPRRSAVFQDGLTTASFSRDSARMLWEYLDVREHGPEADLEFAPIWTPFAVG
jgi:hypothetical protein